jgi:hypothetical protein
LRYVCLDSGTLAGRVTPPRFDELALAAATAITLGSSGVWRALGFLLISIQRLNLP